MEKLKLIYGKAGLSFSKLRYFSHVAKSAESFDRATQPWQSVVGLEIHAQISAQSKLFSGAASQFAAQINQQVALLDTAMPGTLPVLNKRCVEAGVLTALALKCHLNLVSKFDRKHYFYADLPAGYQITQQREPLGVGGEVSYLMYNPSGGVTRAVHRQARIIQLQLEQDSGKSLHDEEDNCSLIDLNRAGIALMEIVTEPDFTCGEEAACFVKELQRMLQLLGTCDGKMEEGSLRVDASVSLNRPGEPLGTRAEVKNINSVRNVARAVDFEIERQRAILDNGGQITNETRSYDGQSGETVSMRDKERLHDYRFMPEPNLPPLRLVTDQMLEAGHQQPSGEVVNVDVLRQQLPRLPKEERDHLYEEYGLTLEQACVLVNEEGLQIAFEQIMEAAEAPSSFVCNFITNDVLQALNLAELSWNESCLSWKHILEITDMLHTGKLSLKIAKRVLSMLVSGEATSAMVVVEQNQWWQVTDDQVLEEACLSVIEKNSQAVDQFRAGKKKILNFLIGQVQKELSGRADVKKVNMIMMKKLKQN